MLTELNLRTWYQSAVCIFILHCKVKYTSRGISPHSACYLNVAQSVNSNVDSRCFVWHANRSGHSQTAKQEIKKLLFASPEAESRTALVVEGGGGGESQVVHYITRASMLASWKREACLSLSLQFNCCSGAVNYEWNQEGSSLCAPQLLFYLRFMQKLSFSTQTVFPICAKLNSLMKTMWNKSFIAKTES